MAASARFALLERPDWCRTAWQEGLGEVYLVLYVHARKGEIEGAVGGNKVPLGLGGGPAATRSHDRGFLLEREKGFLGKIIYVAPHRFPP